jgi:uncharacterized protein YbaP (TraB family)
LRAKRAGSWVFAAALAMLLTAASAAEAPIPSPAPFLWRIQGAHATHYLIGSVHVLPERARTLPPALEAAFRAATGGIVLETDLVTLTTPAFGTRMVAAGQAAQPGLRGELGEPLYARVRRQLHTAGRSADLCDSFRAWFCGYIVEQLQLQQAGFASAYGLDQHFLMEAQALHRRVDWLEPPAQHLGIFTDMPEPVAREFLAASLDADQGKQDGPGELFRLWSQNDVDGLGQMMGDVHKNYPALYARLLGDRNRAWQPQFARLLDEAESRLIVVGAGHCVGPQGLVAQLLARGVTIVPVAPPAPAASPPVAAHAHRS